MIFYALIGPVLILSLVMLVYLRRLKKHDEVLYAFCEIRREIMAILRRDLFEIQREKYVGLKHLLDATGNAIHYYNDNKATMFNYRRFAQWLRDSRASAETVQRLNLPNDPEILKIREHFGVAMVSAFCAYTPLFRSELLIRVSLLLLRTAVNAGWQQAEGIFQFADWFRNFSSTTRGGHSALCHR